MEIAEEIKRSTDGRVTLQLADELLDKARQQSAEIEESTRGLPSATASDSAGSPASP